MDELWTNSTCKISGSTNETPAATTPHDTRRAFIAVDSELVQGAVAAEAHTTRTGKPTIGKTNYRSSCNAPSEYRGRGQVRIRGRSQGASGYGYSVCDLHSYNDGYDEEHYLTAGSRHDNRYGQQPAAEPLSYVPRHESRDTRDQGNGSHQNPRTKQEDEIQPAYPPRVLARQEMLGGSEKSPTVVRVSLISH